MKKLLAGIPFVLWAVTVWAQSGLVGHWTFDDPSNLTAAAVGNDLVLHGSQEAVAGPDSADGAVRIPRGSYYLLRHGLPPSYGSRVNEFTLVIDVKVPSLGRWYCMYQTDLTNTSDGDWFISPSGAVGVGQTGYTEAVIKPGEWYRLGIAVRNGLRYDYYIDGVKMLNGSPGPIDGRFSLDTSVLLFADENGEDNTMDVADVKLFSRALSDSEMQALGGYHKFKPEVGEPDTAIYPYLQSPTPTSIYVCWNATAGTESRVEYGTTPDLGETATGSYHVFPDSTIWHWVKLENLTPSTLYYYRAITDTMQSEVYRFKTAPPYGSRTGHIRFAVMGDTRTDVAQFTKVVAALKEKVQELYGGSLEENLNVLLHVGDVVTSGGVLSQYRREFFGPLSQISGNVPVMVSIGDHEHDSPYYYAYMKYEDFAGPEGEYYYAFQYGRVLFVAVHSIRHTETQLQWLDHLMQRAQDDTTIDWVFAYTHRPGHSEVWPDGNEAYTQEHIIPILKKYSKADLLVYGHSHNYERGQVTDGNLRLMLNGGGGSALDRWRMYSNQRDYPEIQKSFDVYCYTIFDIDVQNKRYEARSFTLGNHDKPRDNVQFDSFFRDKANETPPARPQAISPKDSQAVTFPISLEASGYAGEYPILSSQFQVTARRGDYSTPVLDVKRDFENIYYDTGAPDYEPIDRNKDVDLTTLTSRDPRLWLPGRTYWWRVRYRDRNLQWSQWSEEASFTVASGTGVKGNAPGVIRPSHLYRSYPNPFNPGTTIRFDLASRQPVQLRIFDVHGRLVRTLVDGVLAQGHHELRWDGRTDAGTPLASGTYLCRLRAGDYTGVQKLLLIR